MGRDMYRCRGRSMIKGVMSDEYLLYSFYPHILVRFMHVFSI